MKTLNTRLLFGFSLIFLLLSPAQAVQIELVFVGVDGGSSVLGHLDPDTGALINSVELTGMPGTPESVAVASEGFYYVGTDLGEIYLVDGSSGAILNNFFSFLGSVTGLAIDGNTLTAGDGTFPDFFDFAQNPLDLSLIPIGPQPLSFSVTIGALEQIGIHMLLTSSVSTSTLVLDQTNTVTDTIQTPEPVKGIATLPFGVGDSIFDLIMWTIYVDQAGGFQTQSTGASLGTDIHKFDYYGNLLDTVTAPVDSINGLTAITVATVPIPAAFWLFGSGLIGLIGISRR